LTAINERVAIIGGWNSCESLSEKGMFSTRHISVITENIDEEVRTTRWLVSPNIDLSGGENYQLTFDLALTDMGSNYPISPEDYADTDDKFIVAVNEIGNPRWVYDSTTTWQGAKLHAIPNTGEHIRIDLSEFANKVVQVAFYVVSNHKNSTMEVHLDNVHINAYDIETMSVSLCGMEDYYDEHFDIKYEDIEVGSNQFSHMYENRAKHDNRIDLNINISGISFVCIVWATPIIFCISRESTVDYTGFIIKNNFTVTVSSKANLNSRIICNTFNSFHISSCREYNHFIIAVFIERNRAIEPTA
jgi:hypothetical protein